MSALTLIIQDPPYRPGDKAWHALRFAGAALADGSEVRVFFLGDGVVGARREHTVTQGKEDVQALLRELMSVGLEVYACGRCLTLCCVDEGELMDGVRRGSMKILSTLVSSSQHVLTF
jgi:sulfur relay (sulfurtransferase) complex TusBCD TusD component (DsrE family)